MYSHHVEFEIILLYLYFVVSAHITQGRSDELMGKSLKLPRFTEASRGKAPDEIVDNGDIPGNKEGAGGIDSYFFR